MVVSQRDNLKALAFLFLKLGSTAFGGPAAHIALMEEEVVRRRKWLTASEFLDLLGVTNLIPGPNSTELAIHIGYRMAGWWGLVVAGLCFMAPATLIVWILARLYVQFGYLPEVTKILSGVTPVIVAVLLQAVWQLGKIALKTRFLTALGLGCVLATAWGCDEVLLLFLAGGISLAVAVRPFQLWSAAPIFVATPPILSIASAVPFTLDRLFFFFLKVGSLLYGSGYVLLAFLQADLVDRWHWLTSQQLLDAVAVGQITPGPVFTTATFVGYILNGNAGAATATAGIFLPAFVFVAITAPFLAKWRDLVPFRNFLNGVNVGSLALLVAVTGHLGQSTLVDAKSWCLTLLSFFLLLRYRINSTWLILLGLSVGFLFF